jgi:hypothetical protein
MSFNTSHVTPMKNADGSPNDEEVAFYTPKNQDAKDSRSSFFPLTLCSFVSIVSPDGKDVRNSTLQTDSFDDDVCPICLESLYKACNTNLNREINIQSPKSEIKNNIMNIKARGKKENLEISNSHLVSESEERSEANSDPSLRSIANMEENIFVVTRCKHRFHRECLLEAKVLNKSECPLCRSLLTPPPANAYRLYQSNKTDTFNPTLPISVNSQAVISAATRGREAVRRALLLRHQATNDDGRGTGQQQIQTPSIAESVQRSPPGSE